MGNSAINEYLESSYKNNKKKGLYVETSVLKALGSPHDKIKAIHIAGTNGKGSQAVLLNNILQEEGYKVGLFTSPHIIDFNERIKINSVPISDEDMLIQINKLKAASKKVYEDKKNIIDFSKGKNKEPIDEKSIVDEKKIDKENIMGFFENMTVMAINYFYEKNVDFVILETGIGGRRDSTNVIKSPILTIITSISKDHMNVLGKKITEIAVEKAGIIKKNCPLVLYSQSNKVYNEIEKFAIRRNADLYYIENELNVFDINYSLEKTSFSVTHKYFKYNNIEIKLLGKFQIYNTINVLLAIEALKKIGVEIKGTSIYNALRETSWLGRMQLVKRGGKIILLEGAHNFEAILKLKESIDIYFKNKRVTIVFGILSDKQYKKIINYISYLNADIILTRPLNAKAVSPLELKKSLGRYGLEDNTYSKFMLSDNYEDAINMALSLPNEIIAVTGSLYLVSDAIKFFQRG